ncbi:MAG TPA: ethanolamine ammonia-lyase subunit EutC [Firmicutes bacterium]|nr:ethanolamine ammonia-lyase subunit EutC [Bacillota bacterium]
MDERLLELITQEVLKRVREPGIQKPDDHTDDPDREYERWRVSVLSSEDYLWDITSYDIREKWFIEEPIDQEFLARLKASTPARIGLGRCGPRYRTIPWLRFRADHAAAMDAVFSEVPEELIKELGLVSVRSQCSSRQEYVQRPDLGQKLAEESKEILRSQCPRGAQVQIVVTDGLSSSAIVENAKDFLQAFKQGLSQEGLITGTPIFVRYGRVAIMDDIGEVLQPEAVAELIGERPGLVTAKSMSVYMCYRPRRGTVESDRSVVANIHAGGLPPAEAGAHVASMMKQILTAKASGIRLSTGREG